MNILWQPQEGQQTKFLQSPVYEVLYGGAAGGGKSDAILMDALRQIDIPRYNAIIFRKTFPQLSELIERSQLIYRKIGGKYNDSKKVWIFPSGAKVNFSHMEHEKDKYNHDGKEYHFIGFDELTHFSESQYLYLHSRCRTVDPNLKCYIRASAMPIGDGISWVKQRFIDLEPEKVFNDPETGLERMFIPAKLEDNKILLEGDPDYIGRLKMQGNKLFQALRHGDWDVIQGAAFDELDKTVHMIPPCMPPEGALVWRCMDWGYSRPFSIGWYFENYDGQIIRFREWYGWNGKANTGLKLGAREVAKGILDYEKDLVISGYNIADPAIFSKQDDSPSIAENMRDIGVLWEPADNDRIQGKMEVHNRLRINDDRSGFMVTEDCKQFWRTFPVIQVDERKPEDVDTKAEDHLYDEVRYSLMSRPVITGNVKVGFGNDTITSTMDW